MSKTNKQSARAVARKYKNREQTLDSMLESMRKRQRVIEKPQNSRERELAEKYQREQEIDIKVSQLLNIYGPAGLSRARAIQAVKTDKVAELQNQWNPKLAEWKKVQEAMRRGRMGDLLARE